MSALSEIDTSSWHSWYPRRNNNHPIHNIWKIVYNDLSISTPLYRSKHNNPSEITAMGQVLGPQFTIDCCFLIIGLPWPQKPLNTNAKKITNIHTIPWETDLENCCCWVRDLFLNLCLHSTTTATITPTTTETDRQSGRIVDWKLCCRKVVPLYARIDFPSSFSSTGMLVVAPPNVILQFPLR